MASQLECIILIGLPGSGKTTFYEQRFAKSHCHISKDLWPNASGRENRQQKLIEEKLGAGESVVIDNTNPTIQERARIIKMARGYQARVAAYYFDVSTRAAVARNAARTGRGKVPNVAIFTTAKRLQPPTEAEGFDELFRVQLNEDRSLRITKVLP
jgi:predicted kinase